MTLDERIRTALRSRADPARAPGQQAYMKSAMPFLGIPVPEVRRIARSCARGETDAAMLPATVRTLWDGASHREERYAALALLALPPLEGDPAQVPLIVHLVRTGAWWDFTDELAHRVAALHDRDPSGTALLVRTWSTDADLWLRRLAILSQLGRRHRVDAAVLADVIEPNRTDPEFFLRKAIGWALRDYARVAPGWVRRYCDAHELSPLSRREALRHLG